MSAGQAQGQTERTMCFVLAPCGVLGFKINTRWFTSLLREAGGIKPPQFSLRLLQDNGVPGALTAPGFVRVTHWCACRSAPFSRYLAGSFAPALESSVLCGAVCSCRETPTGPSHPSTSHTRSSVAASPHVQMIWFISISFSFSSHLSAVSQKSFTISCTYFASDVAIDRGIFLRFFFSMAVNHLPLLVIANAF